MFCSDDIDECFTDKADCNKYALCSNNVGSFTCSCKEGYFGDGFSCLQGNCPDSNCPKHQKCVSETTLDCECKPGFILNLTNCIDFDECHESKCDEDSECENTIGSFTCRSNEVATTTIVTNRAKPSTTVQTTTQVAKTTSTTSTTSTEVFKEATTLTTEYDTIFVFQSRYDIFIISPSGRTKEYPYLAEDSEWIVPTESDIFTKGACPITWQDDLYLFGSGDQHKQIYKFVDSRQLFQRVATLPFVHYSGTCSILNNEILLCFSSDRADQFSNAYRCRKAAGPLKFTNRATYSDVIPSSESHCRIQTPTSKSEYGI